MDPNSSSTSNPFHETFEGLCNAIDGQSEEVAVDNYDSAAEAAAAATPANPFNAAIAQQQQQQQQPLSSTEATLSGRPHRQRGLRQGGGRRPSAQRMMEDEGMPRMSSTIDTTPRRASRPPSLEPPSQLVVSQEPSVSFAVPQTISTSRWSQLFGSVKANADDSTPPLAGLEASRTTASPAATTSNGSSTAEDDQQDNSTSTGSNSSATGSSSSPNNSSRSKQPLKQSKQRQTKRRWRFRQGMRQAGINLGVLAEGDMETERTSHITEEQFDEDFSQSLRNVLTCQTCWQSGWCQMALICLLCFAVVLLVVCVVVYFLGGFAFLESSNDSSNNSTVAPTVIDWTWDPSILNGPPRPVRDLLPSFTLSAIQDDPKSPQAQAVAWVEGHPLELANYSSMENWKKVQLVALASFYYAFNGKDWPAEKQKDWLSYDKDECEWGDPGREGQYFGVGCHDNSDQDKAGRFRALNLDWFLGFGLVGFPESVDGNRMPPEIVFLTHLESLGLMNCGLAAVLTNLLPPTLPQLPSLSRLSYRFNRIVGSIPPMMGALTKLEYLSLGSNYVTGTMPRELGALTNLKELFLYSNDLVGSMPTEVGRLTNLREFSAISNDLTGSIPAAVSNWEFLQYFFVDHNPMTGSVPDGICQLPNLTSVLVPCSVDCGSDCGTLCECF